MTSTDRTSDYAEYRYPASQYIITYFLMPVASLTTLWMGILAYRHAAISVGIFLIFFSTCIIFLAAYGSLVSAKIGICNRGISALNFGTVLKFIPYNKITSVRKVRRWNPGRRAFEDIFYVFDADFTALQNRLVNLRGPICFSGDIKGLRRLLDKINYFSNLYSFPISFIDQEAAVMAARAAGKLPFSGLISKIDETSIAEL